MSWSPLLHGDTQHSSLPLLRLYPTCLPACLSCALPFYCLSLSLSLFLADRYPPFISRLQRTHLLMTQSSAQRRRRMQRSVICENVENGYKWKAKDPKGLSLGLGPIPLISIFNELVQLSPLLPPTLYRSRSLSILFIAYALAV